MNSQWYPLKLALSCQQRKRWQSLSLWNWLLYEICIILTLKLIILLGINNFHLEIGFLWDMNHFHFEIDYCTRYESFALWIWLLYEIWIIFHLKLIIVWDMNHFPFEIDFLWDINHFHFEIEYCMRSIIVTLKLIVLWDMNHLHFQS